MATDGHSGAAAKKLAPLDLSHHFSGVTRARVPSKMKEYYKFFQIPGIGNLAGGLPNARFFPFDTLEGQAAKPERWTPSAAPTQPVPPPVFASSSSPSSSSGEPSPPSDRAAPTHVVVPKLSGASDPIKKIDLTTALQYGLAQGYPPLLSFVRQFARDNLHPNVPYAGGPDVVLTCGSTDGFAKTLQLLVDPWVEGRDDPRDRPALLCEVFVYGNALSQAMPLGMQVAAVELDGEGMLATGPGGLEDVLANWDESKGKRPRVMYSVTMGHNPTSGVLSLERRRQIYALCSQYDVIIVEDDPYWYLQYPSAEILESQSRGGGPVAKASQLPPGWKSSGYPFLDSLVPSYLSIDVDGRVVRLDTFSKTVAPGCRLGWITAQPEFIERFVRITETSTQQPSGFVQAMVAELAMGPQDGAAVKAFHASQAALVGRRGGKPNAAVFAGWKTDGWVRWLEGLRGEYERRMNRMCTFLDEGMFRVVEVAGKGSGIGAPDLAFPDARPRKTNNPSALTANDVDADRWSVVTKTQLYEYDWPRGGMFIWIRMLFESHPLWGMPFPQPPPPPPVGAARRSPASAGPAVVNGPQLSTALMMFLTHKPYLTLVSPGMMFSATPNVRAERGWQYYRLCFAAETEDRIDGCSKKFADAARDFWAIESLDELKDLLDEAGGLLSAADEDEDDEDEVQGAVAGMADLSGGWLGC